MSKKFTYEEVKNYVEMESSSGCKLISTEYINIMTKMKFQCRCGNFFETNLNEFKHGKSKKQQCNTCGNKAKLNWKRLTYNEVKLNIEKLDYQLLSNKYVNNSTKLKLLCKNKHVFHMSYNDLQGGHGCWICQDDICRKTKYTYEEVDSYLRKFDYTLVSNKYKNARSNLEIVCPKGHTFFMAFHSFSYSNQRCPQCYKENLSGMTNIKTTLRNNLEQWKRDSMEACNYKCVITSFDFDDVHHVYSFDSIVKDMCKELEIEEFVSQVSGDLTENQISFLKEKCLEHHYKHPLGVCITREYHRLFHRLYGFYNNTEQQFYEFVTRCRIGEFDEIMEVKYGEYFQN